jgi:hypothetical protein
MIIVEIICGYYIVNVGEHVSFKWPSKGIASQIQNGHMHILELVLTHFEF